VRSLALGLAFLVCSVSASALAAPRQIRLSLDDESTGQLSRAGASHAEFPLVEQPAPPRPGRLIRLTLDDGGAVYGHLRHLATLGRRIRTSLD
jgi:hypothetical protein